MTSRRISSQVIVLIRIPTQDQKPLMHRARLFLSSEVEAARSHRAEPENVFVVSTSVEHFEAFGRAALDRVDFKSKKKIFHLYS